MKYEITFCDICGNKMLPLSKANKFNITYIDCDEVAHEISDVCSCCANAIVKHTLYLKAERSTK